MKHLRNTLITAVTLALVAFAVGCAYNGDGAGTSEPYRSPSNTGHHH